MLSNNKQVPFQMTAPLILTPPTALSPGFHNTLTFLQQRLYCMEIFTQRSAGPGRTEAIFFCRVVLIMYDDSKASTCTCAIGARSSLISGEKVVLRRN